jgi:penicillin-binding protein 1C
MGGNLEGVRAGSSLAWLGKEPDLLAPAEAALLVALPQSPTRLRPDQQPARAESARNRILERAGAIRLLTPAGRDGGRWRPRCPQPASPCPFLAPHLAEQLAKGTSAAAPDRDNPRGTPPALRRAGAGDGAPRASPDPST